MKTKLTIVAGILLLLAANAFGQGGGKAEPKRVKFAKGKTSVILTGTLSNSQDMEYIFAAKARQTVKLKVASAPKGDFFSFGVGGANGIELETEYDRYSDYTFTAPKTGSYLLTVTKNPTEKVPKAKFSLTLTIK